jgi:hypothetical protein
LTTKKTDEDEKKYFLAIAGGTAVELHWVQKGGAEHQIQD